MKLSKRGEYALRALIDLGIASELGWPMLQASELAAKEKLPIKFLEQIFAQLKAAGYVESRRGKFGGYSLARPMRRIKFGAVIRLIDGPLAPIRCVSQTSYARCSIASLSETSSRSHFANIAAIKSHRLLSQGHPSMLHQGAPAREQKTRLQGEKYAQQEMALSTGKRSYSDRAGNAIVRSATFP